MRIWITQLFWTLKRVWNNIFGNGNFQKTELIAGLSDQHRLLFCRTDALFAGLGRQSIRLFQRLMHMTGFGGMGANSLHKRQDPYISCNNSLLSFSLEGCPNFLCSLVISLSILDCRPYLDTLYAPRLPVMDHDHESSWLGNKLAFFLPSSLHHICLTRQTSTHHN